MTIKQRALQHIINVRTSEVSKIQALANKVQIRAFSIPEISHAQANYSAAIWASKGNEKDANLIKAKAEFEKVLKANNLSLDKLYPNDVICDKCKDACIVNGVICSCSVKTYIDTLRKESGLMPDSFTFSDDNLKGVKDSKTKEVLEKAYHQMSVFVNKYPNVKKNTFVFSGLTGTGKTCLSQAVANGLLEKGFSVKYVSAFAFNNAMIAVHTAPIESRNDLISDYLTCDLLVIDDLGTEPITRNVTLEYLYLVLSTRQEKNLSTIISTNLDGDGIMTRYQERIFSRLTSKAFSLSYNFEGIDLRKI